MIVEEEFYINGIRHIRRYSDCGCMIASDDGIEYGATEDLAGLDKAYHETGTPAEIDNVEAVSILNIILGGETE